MENKRQEQCSCGSKLRCLEVRGDKTYVVCVGVGCDREWLSKRSTDRDLMLLRDAKEEFRGK